MSFLIEKKSYFLCLIAGMLYALGFPLFNGNSIFFAPIIGFAILYSCLLSENKIKKQLLMGLSYSLGFYLLGFYWIPFLLKEFGGLSFPFNYLLGLLFSLFIIPQTYFFILIQRKIKNPLILAFIYTLLEQFIPQQFPAHLGHSYASLVPNLNLVFAPIFGAAFYSFFTASISLSLISHLKTKKIQWAAYSFIIITIIFHYLPILKNAPSPIIQTLKIRIVQPNIGNFLKLDSERGGINSIKSIFENYLDLSTKNTTDQKNLIIWPETSFPNLLYSDILKSSDEVELPFLIKDIIQKTGSHLFIGGYDSKPGIGNFQSDYNSAFLFTPEMKLQDVYHKRKLIPFGEGLPFGPLNPYLSKLITNISYFAEGDRFNLFNIDNKSFFTSVICYEVLFTDFVRQALNEQDRNVHFLVNLTNDSWYGQTAEPFQHLFLTKWRALELNLPVVRSTNTGITTIIYPNGSESNRLGVGEKNYIDLDLDIKEREKTIYQKLGLWGLILLALFWLFIDLALKRKSFLE